MICYCCGSTRIKAQSVLWKELIDEWRISNYEADYINKQQGLHCADCNSNLRSMALAFSIMRCFSYEGYFNRFVKDKKYRKLKILEINEAGNLTQFLSHLTGHILAQYPNVDMMDLKFDDETFDLVLHSDVLEHVLQPVKGLSECRRVLKPRSVCAFTVPIIVDRLTIRRDGLPSSYHGSSDNKFGFLVHTEYGSDAWQQIIQAGFDECRIFSIDYPAAQALAAIK
jgi:SAM-dependent methyltransferase